MSVIINASIDGTSYPDITKIITGGKTINLSGINEGSDLPAQIAEIKYSTFSENADAGVTVTEPHGCSGTPDIIIIWSDFRTHYTSSVKPQGSTIVGMTYNGPAGVKDYSLCDTTYTGTTGPNNNPGCAGLSSTNDGHITDVGDSTFSILAKSNRRIGAGLTYSVLAIRLA